MHDQVVEQEVDGVLQTTSVVPGENEMEDFNLLFLAFNLLRLRLLKLCVYNVLSLELL